MPFYRVTWTKPGDPPHDSEHVRVIEAPNERKAIDAIQATQPDSEHWAWSAMLLDAQKGPVIAQLREYLDAIDDLLRRIEAREYGTREGRSRMSEDYAALKRRLKEGAKRPAQNRDEMAFLLPAVQKAHAHPAPATNTHPHNSNWFGALYAVRIEFTYMLSQLEGG